MSDFLLADGFGNLSDGTHTAGATREILGDLWTAYGANFVIEDRGDGRKWMKNKGSVSRINLVSLALPDLTTLRFCFRIIRATAADVMLCSLFDGASNMGGIYINAAGQVVYSNYFTGDQPDAGIVATGPVIPTNTETFVEVVVVLGNAAAGSVTFYVGGVLDSTVASIDTINSGTACDILKICYYSTDTYGLPDGWKLSDFIVHTAASPLGDVGVFYVPCDTAGTDADFTPSAGSNEDNVDEIGPDEDTTYNESDGTAGHRDSFTGDGVSGVTVLSVASLVRARKTDSGAATLILGAVHGASEDQSAARSLSEDYLTLIEFFDDCPSTAAAWTPAQVTAAELSYEVGA